MSINGDGMIFQGAMVRALLDGTKTQTRRPLYTLRKGSERAQKRAMFLKDYPPPNPITTMDLAYYYDLRHILDVGGKVWVRESWRVGKRFDQTKPRDLPPRTMSVMFEAGGSIANHGPGPTNWQPDGEWPVAGEVEPWAGKLRPSIFLPRWASRLTLTVTDVRIERLLDISEADAIAEGIVFRDFGEYVPNGQMSIDGGKTFHGFKPRQHDGWHWGEAIHPDQCLGSARSAYCNLWNHINGDGAATANPWVVAYTFSVDRKNIDA